MGSFNYGKDFKDGWDAALRVSKLTRQEIRDYFQRIRVEDVLEDYTIPEIMNILELKDIQVGEFVFYNDDRLLVTFIENDKIHGITKEGETMIVDKRVLVKDTGCILDLQETLVNWFRHGKKKKKVKAPEEEETHD